jgi:outer membrane protein OmpA-like peptidoglycan-associated protein
VPSRKKNVSADEDHQEEGSEMHEFRSLIIKAIALIMMSLIPGLAIAALGQTRERQVQIEKPVTETRSALAISYPEGPTLGVKLVGTDRLPGAKGEAKVERKKGSTEIEIELDEMKPATLFGGDFATYVLWTVSPEGHVSNAGEFILNGNRSKLNVASTLQTFGLFVTAEPHYLVESPSRFVVLENSRPAKNLTTQMLEVSTIKYRGFDGIYNYVLTSIATEPESKGIIRSDVRQARVSLSLAERAGAEQYAAEELALARESWRKTAQAAEARIEPRQLMVLGHETVRLAYDAEKRARERGMQAALDAERAQRAQQISDLRKSIDAAQTDAERARLLAEQQEMTLTIEKAARARAQAEAEQLARAAAEEARRREEAEKRAMMAEQNAATATREADAARAERDAARARLRDALSVVVEVRETARGLVVNLPDILFDFNKASLKPDARERLSKVCGILMVAGGQKLSIEGHTDNVGSDEYNQKLSEQRAASVMQYLTSCGLPSELLASHGFGEGQPVAPNETADGRQKNRRVEIIIQDKGAAAEVGVIRQ